MEPLGSGVKSSEEPQTSRGQGDLVVLSDPHRIRSDCNMIRRAVKEGWIVDPDKRPAVVDRLLEIVETREVTVVTSSGEALQVTDQADKNAIAAARVLAAMSSEAQADRHHVENHNQKERHHADDLAVNKANAMSNAANAGLVKLYGKRAPTEEV